MLRQSRWLLVCLFAGVFMVDLPLWGAITPEQRKEIAELRKDLTKANAHLTKKEYDEARQLLDSTEEKLRKICSDAKVPESDKALAPLFTQIQQKRTLLDKKAGAGGDGAGGIGFEKDIAPLLAAKCMNCHNEDRNSGGLRLDNFAGLEAGGENGPLLAVGNANNSRIIAAVRATGNARMPRNGEPLSAQEINTLASWINQGAKFDGQDKQARFAARGAAPRANAGPPAPIVRATGNEKASFTKDIAPFMVNLCGGCHGGNNPRGGLSLVSFESLMKGGNSGRVIIAGNLEGSRLWRLVGGLELPRMPQGQARITRKNYDDLKTWLEEGAKFDGPDPKTPLRQLVPTEEQIRAEKLNKLSPEEFAAMRVEATQTQWKRANPKDEAIALESQDFYLYGNVSEPRLKEIQGWADEFAKTLREEFRVSGDEIWRGKLAIMVFKDRFSYEEFPRVVEMAEVPKETIGHSRVSADYSDAYVCVEDIGDDISASSPGMKLNVLDQITGAFLKRGGDKVPDWMIRGTGLALASQGEKKNEYIQQLGLSAVDALKGLESPEQVFEKGKFSSADLGPIGYTLVKHILIHGGPAKFGQLVGQLQTGTELNAALKNIYNADPKTLGLSYLSSLGNVKPGKTKKK